MMMMMIIIIIIIIISKGCKDQLMISKVIYEDCRRRNRNLSIAWIDYQKAFDSVPRSWVEKSGGSEQ